MSGGGRPGCVGNLASLGICQDRLLAVSNGPGIVGLAGLNNGEDNAYADTAGRSSGLRTGGLPTRVRISFWGSPPKTHEFGRCSSVRRKVDWGFGFRRLGPKSRFPQDRSTKSGGARHGNGFARSTWATCPQESHHGRVGNVRLCPRNGGTGRPWAPRRDCAEDDHARSASWESAAAHGRDDGGVA